MNGDGALTPQTDAVDLDRDGVAAPAETLSVLFGPRYDSFAFVPVGARPTEFRPTHDWLYVDADGDGARNYGSAAGFDESTPAYGEPLFVADDGPGVPEADQERLFERFYRAAGGQASGSGLGLAIASELAARMNGSIDVSSEPGSTVFTLLLLRSQRTPAPEAISRENALR